MLARIPGESEESWISRTNEYHKKWVLENKDKVRANMKRYRERHASLISARRKVEYIKNHEEKIKYKREWDERNREKVRGYSRKYEATHIDRKRGTPEQIEAQKEYQRKRYRENLEAERQRSKEKTAKRAAKGKCVSCNNPGIYRGSLCETHYFAARATQRLGLGPHTIERGQMLKDVFEKQGRICPYTGIELKLGENASVDHIQCSSKHPELRGEISNIEWVDLKVNRMKTDMDKDEFIAMCHLIASRNPLP